MLDEHGLTAADAEPWMWEDWFATPDVEVSTRQTRLSHIRAAYNYARKRGVIDNDPTHLVMLPRLADEEPVIVPNADLRAMKGQLWEERGILLFHLLTYTGMRKEEIQYLTWEDVDLEAGTITTIGKGGKLRHIPIHPALAEELAHYQQPEGLVLHSHRRRLDGEWMPLSDKKLYALVQEFAGEYKPHDFRRTVASSLIQNGTPETVVDKIMGWAPRTVGRRYYIKVAGPELQRGILRLYADDPV
jgi:integrase